MKTFILRLSIIFIIYSFIVLIIVTFNLFVKQLHSVGLGDSWFRISCFMIPAINFLVDIAAYIRTKNKLFLILAVLNIIIFVLSDWYLMSVLTVR